MDESSPARLYCLLIGAALVLTGVLGFFYESSFASGDEVVRGDVLGLLAVNGWHNVVHMAIGALLLLAAGSAARAAAFAAGLLYLALAVLGFIATGGDGIGNVAQGRVLFDLVPVDLAGNVLHALLGISGVIAATATPRAAAAAA